MVIKTALHYAAAVNAMEFFNLLSWEKINFYLKDDLGNTFFHYAIINNCEVFIDVAFHHFTLFAVQDNNGHTPLQLALNLKDLACFTRILSIFDTLIEKQSIGENDIINQDLPAIVWGILKIGDNNLDQSCSSNCKAHCPFCFKR